MKYFFLIILCLNFVTACGNNKQKEESGFDYELIVPEGGYDPTVIPELALTFDLNLTLANFSSADAAKMDDAIELIKEVVKTQEFKARILNHTYNNVKTFVDNRGYSNAQIYQKLLEGAEALNRDRNNAMDADLELYYDDTNVVGYTYPDTTRIWINTKYFNQYNAAGVARNLFHEWMHKIGFDHAVAWDPSRDYSVPYAVGNIMGDIGNDLLN